jgi:hypothetical protein
MAGGVESPVVELFIRIFKQIPPLWPRLAVVAVIALIMLAPKTRALVMRGGRGKARLDRAKRLLEVRKLQIDVATLRAKNPDVAESPLDATIARILGHPDVHDDEEDGPPLAWPVRLAWAAAGGLAFLAAGALGLLIAGDRAGGETLHVAARELLLLVPGVMLASALPAQARWNAVLYGALVPLLVTALAVMAR